MTTTLPTSSAEMVREHQMSLDSEPDIAIEPAVRSYVSELIQSRKNSKLITSLQPAPGTKQFMGICAFTMSLLSIVPPKLLPDEINLPRGAIFLLAFLGTVAAFISYRAERKAAQKRLNAEATNFLASDERFLLYLRPFATAGRLLVPNTLPKRSDRLLVGPFWDAELGMALAAEPMMRMIALGHTKKGLGAAKIVTADEDWQQRMRDLATRAETIIMVPLNRPSTMIEVEHIFADPKLVQKTIFFMPPTVYHVRTLLRRHLFTASIRRLWRQARRTLGAKGIHIPAYRHQG